MRSHHIDCSITIALTYWEDEEDERSFCTCTAFDHECPEPELKSTKGTSLYGTFPFGIDQFPINQILTEEI